MMTQPRHAACPLAAMPVRYRHTWRWIGREGFSFLELQLALAVAGIITAMAVVSIQSAVPWARGNAVRDQVMSAFRVARETAITQRRAIDVVFVPPGEIRLIRNELTGRVTQIRRVVLEHGGQFMPGLPDTPDQFGANGAVDFGGANLVRFLEDGTFADAAGVPVNGTVYLGIPSQTLANRAITIAGGTGRPQAYAWSGTRWEEQ
jgi:type II secretory pathway pseudopilin PulG